MRRLFLTIKYRTHGDVWSDAWFLAGVLTDGWKNKKIELHEKLWKYRK